MADNIDKKLLKRSKDIFKEVASLCYDFNSDEIDAFIASAEINVKKALAPLTVKDQIEQILDVVNATLDFIDSDILNQINDLLLELDEEIC